MKSKTAGAAYKAARGNLLAMLVLTAVNTLLALTGSDRYYLFTDFAAYIWAAFARGFYDFTGEAKWLVLGAAGAVLVMAVYFLCWLLSKKRRGWLTAALVLFSVDTAALVAGLVTAFEASSILDVVFHGLLLWYLAMGVRRGREAMDRRGADRTRRERRAQRQRRNGVVDFGAHARRVGHIGLDGQFRGALHLRDIGLGHFDLLFDLRRSQLRQHRRESGHYQHLLHRQLSFAIRAFASSTMPSSAGE